MYFFLISLSYRNTGGNFQSFHKTIKSSMEKLGNDVNT